MENFDASEMPLSEKEKAKNIENRSSFEKSISSLNEIMERLKPISITVFVATALNFIVSLITIVKYGSLKFYPAVFNDKGPILGLMILILMLCSAVLGLLYFYEILKKQGVILFEEISNELASKANNKKNSSSSGHSEINARRSLYSFAITTDLPFFPGKFGPAVYLTLNIVLSTISTFYLARLL